MRAKSTILIGLGRDVYEGGKPSCFYLINVGRSSSEYMDATDSYLRSGEKEKDFDHNKKVYVADYNPLRWQKTGELLVFTHIGPGGKKDVKHIRPEKNLLCNLYHYAIFR